MIVRLFLVLVLLITSWAPPYAYAQQSGGERTQDYFQPAFRSSGYLLSSSILSTWIAVNATADAHGGHMYDTERALELLANCEQSLRKTTRACDELLSMPELRAEDEVFVEECKIVIKHMQSHIGALRSYLQQPSDAAWAHYLKQRRIAWEHVETTLQLKS